MAKILHKQSCPTCGQSVNLREITLYDGMVQALANVYKWLHEKRTWEHIKFRDFKHLLGPNELARFSDWRFFAPDMIGGAHGYYDFNQKAINEYLSNKKQYPTRILRNPLLPVDKQDEYFDHRTAREVASIYEFISDDGEFIVGYGETTEKAVEAHVKSYTVPGTTYTIRNDGKGRIWCNCPGYRYRGNCKHIEDYGKPEPARLF